MPDGSFHWPPDYTQEFTRRTRLIGILCEDPEILKAAMLTYKHDCVSWINDWGMTFDPRIEDGVRYMPFILFPRQVEFVNFIIECLQTKQPGLVEKCRDVGASWLCVCISVWLWLFWPGSIIGWGSRKEEYVDDKDEPKAIFTKIRQLIASLPVWMLPPGFEMRKHATYMKIINPSNFCAITGEAGDNIGRGGRTTIYFKDESAHYERPEKIEAALGDNTNVQIDISSVNGPGNVFYRRRFAGQLWSPGHDIPKGIVRVFVFEWRSHPLKTQEWHDLRRAMAEREGLLHVFEQEVERNYAASQQNIIIRPEWIEAMVDAHVKLADWGDWFSGEKLAGQDIADGGGDKNANAGRHGVVLKYAEHWGGEADKAPAIALPMMVENSIEEVFYDSVGVGAGFKGGVNAMKDNGSWPEHLKVHPWSGADEVLDPEKPIIPNDNKSRKNKDHYLNFKAQSWFRVRTRAVKTYRAIYHGERCDVSELMSIDSRIKNIHAIKMELAQAVYKYQQNGKTMVDKNPEGTASPNLGDAVVMCYNPRRAPKGFLDV